MPARPAPRDAEAFPHFVGIRPSNLNETDVSDEPSWVRALPASTETWDELRLRRYRSLLSVGDAIGSIVAALDAAGRTRQVRAPIAPGAQVGSSARSGWAAM